MKSGSTKAMSVDALLPAELIAAAGKDAGTKLGQLIGRVQVANAIAQFSQVLGISQLAEIKASRAYKGWKGQFFPNTGVYDGTWESLCRAIGVSVVKVDEDIENLKAFGEEALESLSRLGVGYREMRNLRRLPEDERVALLEVAQAGDKDAFVELAETIISRNLRERDGLTNELAAAKNKTGDLQVKLTIAQDENKVLQKRLTQAAGHREDGIPFEVVRLRADVVALHKKAELAVTSFRVVLGDLEPLIGEVATHDWADGTLRLAASALADIVSQADGLLRAYINELPGRDLVKTVNAHLSPAELAEASALWRALANAHALESAQREHAHAELVDKALPVGQRKRGPKAKPPRAPGSAA